MNNSFKTSILFIVFCREDTTQRVFEAIRTARPAQLYIAADGPRADRPGEAEKCDKVRNLILQGIDWDCQVKTLFRDHNLGCRAAVSSAIDWFFSQVEEGIILEDDCLPHPDFFRFCEEMLEYYSDDTRIMHIGGGNFQLGRKIGKASYYFSRYSHIWGWASWRRAWQYYDVDIKSFPKFEQQNIVANIFSEKRIQKRWNEILNKIYKKDMIFNTWDFQWNYALFCQNGLSIIPNVNLISNIGCGVEGTNTSQDNVYSGLETYEMGEIVHPEFIVPNTKADDFTFLKFFQADILSKVKSRIKRILK